MNHCVLLKHQPDVENCNTQKLKNKSIIWREESLSGISIMGPGRLRSAQLNTWSGCSQPEPNPGIACTFATKKSYGNRHKIMIYMSVSYISLQTVFQTYKLSYRTRVRKSINLERQNESLCVTATSARCWKLQYAKTRNQKCNMKRGVLEPH